MSKANQTPILILAVLALLGGAYGVHYLLDRETGSELRQTLPQPDPSAAPLQVLPAFAYPDLEGNKRASQEWLGKVLVLNFWATWCPPCRREIPDFIDLQEEFGPRGLQFVGVAIDSSKDAAAFAQEIGVNYPILLGDVPAIELGQALGNRFGGLPFSAIFDRSGKLVHAQAGELSRDDLKAVVLPLL